MKISVIVPTYNRLEQLKRVIVGLEQQSCHHKSFEVIIVSDGSTDGTDDYLHSLRTPLQLRPIFQKNQGAATARNRGVKEAGGEIIVFIDDDLVPSPQLLQEHRRWHESQDNVVVLGPMLTPHDFVMSPWVRWEQAMLTKQYDSMASGAWQPTPRQFYTGNASLARSHLLAAGGFDPAFRRAEDVELAYRLAEQNLRFLFNPLAIGYHYAERSFASWMNIPYAYGRNDVVFTMQKEQNWLLPIVWREFRGRHALVKFLTFLCLDRPLVSTIVLSILKQGAKMRSERVSQFAYSGLFNLRYYQGITDELGGRDFFMAGVLRAGLRAEVSLRPHRMPRPTRDVGA